MKHTKEDIVGWLSYRQLVEDDKVVEVHQDLLKMAERNLKLSKSMNWDDPPDVFSKVPSQLGISWVSAWEDFLSWLKANDPTKVEPKEE